MKIYSCLLVLVLGCIVSEGTIRKVSEEKHQVTLSCPRPVEGTATWSREINGNKVDLLTADGERDIRHNDPGKRYSSYADKFKSLVIGRAAVSDSGTYFCNNEEAVELTVIPSGTTIHNATERTSIALDCPPGVGGSDGPTWSREVAGKQKQIRSPVSTVDKTLTITEVQLRDSGLYYCDGKPAVYLRVIKEKTKPTTTSTTMPTKKTPTVTVRTCPPGTTAASSPPGTTAASSPPGTTAASSPPGTTAASTPPGTTAASTPPGNTASPYLWQTPVRMLLGILYLITMISITVVTWRKAEQIQKQRRLTAGTENDL